VLVRAYNSSVDHGVFIVRVGGQHLEDLLHTPLLAQRAPSVASTSSFAASLGWPQMAKIRSAPVDAMAPI
jgi:hypothetical protein